METTSCDCKISWREVGGERVPYGRISFYAQRAESKDFPVDTENHRMWFRASTPGVKPDNVDIPVKAWKKHLKQYMTKNPAFAWGHDYKKPEHALGHAVDSRIVAEAPPQPGLYLYDQFGYGYNPLATMTWYQFLNGDLNTVSVGWETLKGHKETRDIEGQSVEVYVVDEAQLLEHSACILPMDDDATAMRVRDLAAEHPDLDVAMRAYAQGNDPLAAALRRVLDDEYCSALLCNREMTRPGWEDNDNQVRYQIKPKEQFNEDTYGTLSLDVKGKKDVQVHRARYKDDKDDGEPHAQSISFMKEAGWKLASAKSWWADHKDELSRFLEDPDVIRIEWYKGELIGIIYEIDIHGIARELIRRDRLTMLPSEHDRIGELLERVKRIEAWLTRLDESARVMLEPEPGWVRQTLPPELRELAEIYSDLTDEELRHRVTQALQEITEEITE